eukprot:CAMPEP_0185728656 /NCGR_PEP_ID=MMETSP1171-20130828/4010_1 /TAXON_ID=374046 /ORGANISM="Helicotheca tamensis, Strain CCMP826" /LENGTH=309 /DNA_ID=CAMNT_0028397385 /DNA_START=84 /DNA_END=1013 /DNA_ORIENTATION=-
MRNIFAHLCSLLILAIAVEAEESNRVKVTFVNEFPFDVELFFESSDGSRRVSQGVLKGRGGSVSMTTSLGHSFTYDTTNTRRYIEISQNSKKDVENAIILGPNAIFVRCEVSAHGGTELEDLDIIVRPQWSPWGAQRFLQLIREGYYDGCALNRVVPRFLTQFGIGADYAKRTKVRTNTIPDDPQVGILFRPGYMAYAGSGDNSRSSEVFIVMPETSESQLKYFGTNSWETPFAEVDLSNFGGDATLSPMARWHSYGDMPPYGEGPDSQLIYAEDGYEYLKENFPELDYIQSCFIVDEKFPNDPEVEEL